MKLIATILTILTVATSALADAKQWTKPLFPLSKEAEAKCPGSGVKIDVMFMMGALVDYKTSPSKRILIGDGWYESPYESKLEFMNDMKTCIGNFKVLDAYTGEEVANSGWWSPRVYR